MSYRPDSSRNQRHSFPKHPSQGRNRTGRTPARSCHRSPTPRDNINRDDNPRHSRASYRDVEAGGNSNYRMEEQKVAPFPRDNIQEAPNSPRYPTPEEYPHSNFQSFAAHSNAIRAETRKLELDSDTLTLERAKFRFNAEVNSAEMEQQLRNSQLEQQKFKLDQFLSKIEAPEEKAEKLRISNELKAIEMETERKHLKFAKEKSEIEEDRNKEEIRRATEENEKIKIFNVEMAAIEEDLRIEELQKKRIELQILRRENSRNAEILTKNEAIPEPETSGRRRASEVAPSEDIPEPEPPVKKGRRSAPKRK